VSGAVDGDVKVRKRTPCRPGVAPAGKKHHPSNTNTNTNTTNTINTTISSSRVQGGTTDGVKRPQEQPAAPPPPRWGSLGPRGVPGPYRRTLGPVTFPSTSERLKRATRKNTPLRGAAAGAKVSRGRSTPPPQRAALHSFIHECIYF